MSQERQLRGILSSPRRKLPPPPGTPLISKSPGSRATCHLTGQNPSLGSRPLPRVPKAWLGAEPGLTWQVQAVWAALEAAHLRRSLLMLRPGAHWPQGCHAFDERETLMGSKASSKGKFLPRAGPKVLQSKKSPVSHSAGPRPLPLGTRLSIVSDWISTCKMQGPEPETHLGKGRGLRGHTWAQNASVTALPSQKRQTNCHL